MRARNGVNVPKNMLFFVLLSGMRAGSPVLSELILGRKQGLVRRIGHLKSYRCASKNPGARVRIESARPKHVFCRRRESVPACWPCTIPASAERMACPIGHITCSRFGSRNRSVCPDSGRARTKTHDGAHDCCGETWSGRTVPRGSDLRPRAGRANRSGPPARGPLPGCPADGAALARSRAVQTLDLARAAQTAPGRRRAGRS